MYAESEKKTLEISWTDNEEKVIDKHIPHMA